jgi:hypothetical protein
MVCGKSVAAAGVVVLALVLGACGGAGGGYDERGGKGDAGGSAGGSALARVAVTERAFRAGAFDHSTAIDNRWLLLKAGTQFVYHGGVTEDGERLEHRVVLTVTDLTKVIDGVRTVVIWDRDYTGGQLVEGELAFFAQDNGGNVWLLGEYPEEYEDGGFVGAPDTWIAGLAGARPGIMMRAKPVTGTPSYQQGWAPKIEFADRAKVFATGRSVCVPVDCYRDVLVTDEWNPDEPQAHQRKYYAAGVGNIKVGFAGKDVEAERLALAETVTLDPKALAQVRRSAMALERRAYRVSDDLYGRTPGSKAMPDLAEG